MKQYAQITPKLPKKLRRDAHISSVTSKGQTTIPADMRRETGIMPGSNVHFVLENGRIILEKVQPVDERWNAGQSAMMSEWNSADEDAYND